VFLFDIVLLLSPSSWWRAVPRGWTLCLRANSMPLLRMPLTKRMAASDSARLDVVLRCQLYAIVADIARRYRSRQVDCYLPSSGFRVVSPGRGLATLDTGDGRRRYNSSLVKERDWYRRIVRRYGETYEPNPSRQCEPISSTMCWIGLARKVSQNKSEPFSSRRTCAGERGYHTRGVSRACWASLSKQRYFQSESRPYSMWRDH
jgi:hypothetical protein